MGGAPQGSCAVVQMYAVGIDDMDTSLPPLPVVMEPVACLPDLSSDDGAPDRCRIVRPNSSSSSSSSSVQGGSVPGSSSYFPSSEPPDEAEFSLPVADGPQHHRGLHHVPCLLSHPLIRMFLLRVLMEVRECRMS